MFEIFRNNPNNCLVGKILVWIMNICYWLLLPLLVLEITLAGPLSADKALLAAFCITALVADMFFIHKQDVVLDNPFKKKVPAEVESTPEESLLKAAKSGDDNPDMSIW